MKSKPPAKSERLLPPHAPGMRIGLFGGTFDPPHQAHLAATLLALKRLRLDRVWWLVTPGNPLKNTSGLAPLLKRIAAARALTHHPRIDVTGLEAVIKTRYTYDTISWLRARCPGVRIRLDHGRGQSAEFPSLAEMAKNSGAGAHRGRRPSGPKPLRSRQSRGQCSCPRPHPGTRRLLPSGPKGSRMGLSARSQVAAFIHRTARVAPATGNFRRCRAYSQIQQIQEVENER